MPQEYLWLGFLRQKLPFCRTPPGGSCTTRARHHLGDCLRRYNGNEAALGFNRASFMSVPTTMRGKTRLIMFVAMIGLVGGL
ncbi:MAG: hypothetical protein ACRD41_09235, partial [Candidatus Acidiferrales bacterium]